MKQDLWDCVLCGSKENTKVLLRKHGFPHLVDCVICPSCLIELSNDIEYLPLTYLDKELVDRLIREGIKEEK